MGFVTFILRRLVYGSSLEASLVLDERAPIELLESDAQLLLGVHHDRAVPGDGLADGLPPMT
jgi:hypothetical protein